MAINPFTGQRGRNDGASDKLANINSGAYVRRQEIDRALQTAALSKDTNNDGAADIAGASLPAVPDSADKGEAA